MKVAFIEPHLKDAIGGIRRILEISYRLSFNHDVTIFTPAGKKVSWLPCPKVLPISTLGKESFDVVLFNLAEQYPIAQKAKAKVKAFWVLAPEAMYKNPKIPVAALRQNFYLISNSKFTQDYIKKYVKLDYVSPIVGGGVNPEHFRRDTSIKKEYHVVYMGSNRPWKGKQVIEQALLGTKLKTFCMSGGIAQKDMYKVYNKADICVVANLFEGFSFVELESMACGVPLITTNNGGNQDYVVSGENAVVVRRDVISIRQAILSLVKDKETRKRLVVNGLKTASQERFSWDVITKNFEAILENKLKDTP